MTAKQLFELPIGRCPIDTMLVRLAQITCFVIASFVFLLGISRVSRLDVSEAEFFGAFQQVVQTALLFCIFGLVLERKANV